MLDNRPAASASMCFINIGERSGLFERTPSFAVPLQTCLTIILAVELAERLGTASEKVIDKTVTARQTLFHDVNENCDKAAGMIVCGRYHSSLSFVNH